MLLELLFQKTKKLRFNILPRDPGSIITILLCLDSLHHAFEYCSVGDDLAINEGPMVVTFRTLAGFHVIGVELRGPKKIKNFRRKQGKQNAVCWFKQPPSTFIASLAQKCQMAVKKETTEIKHRGKLNNHNQWNLKQAAASLCFREAACCLTWERKTAFEPRPPELKGIPAKHFKTSFKEHIGGPAYYWGIMWKPAT